MTERDQDRVVSTDRDRFEWMEIVLRFSTLTDAQKCVAARLALHLNGKTLRCNPPIDLLMKGTALKERSVQNAISTLETEGLLRRQGGGGRGRSWNYQLVIPRDRADSAETVHVDAPFEGQEETPQGGAPFAEKVHYGAENGARPRAKRCTAVRHNMKNKKNTESEVRRSFEKWWLIFPTRVAKGDAWKAYERIIRTGLATPEELEQGAQRYEIERRGQNPKYTKHPANWLIGECWADEGASASVRSMASSSEDWDRRVASFQQRSYWPSAFGPAPGLAGCRAPSEILERHGYAMKEAAA
jgi:hypothetical protein